MNPKILDIDGWTHPPELEWLFATARKVPKGGLIVEIGAWKGRSTAALYEGAGLGKTVVTIDTFKGQDDDLGHAEARQHNIFTDCFLPNMRELGFPPKPYACGAPNGHYFIKRESVPSAAMFEDESIDMLFIDGDHRFCGADIDAFLPKMKTPSLITGHDYFCFFETIQQEIHKRFFIQELHHSIWVRWHLHKRPTWY
jgi:hypothetical protein